MKYSVIIPVYNRPEEVKELLESLCEQSFTDFEVVVVEDGSSVTCEKEVALFQNRLPSLLYFQKENSGPGQTRNFGADHAHGDYLIILDSDCVAPSSYFEAIEAELTAKPCDAFGGPDRAHADFTAMQKAINYAMTSFFTTGGIRGGKKKLDKFYPRSFNMGIRRSVFNQLGGFSKMRFGEDIDLSIRIFEQDYSCRLFPEAWVWHKRRTDLKKFFKQVHNSGIARINLWKRHPQSLKVVHLLPSVFVLGVVVLLIAGCLWSAWALAPLFCFALLILVDASLSEHSLEVGIKAVAASFVQLIGYGTGFLRAFVERVVLGRGEFEAFKKSFYK